MATYKGGKGQRGGEWKKRDSWSGPRDYNKSGNSSPSTRSHSPWRDYREHYREVQHRLYAKHLQEEWKKVEQDLVKDSGNVTGTVEYVSKTPIQTPDIKGEEPKNREEKPPSPN